MHCCYDLPGRILLRVKCVKLSTVMYHHPSDHCKCQGVVSSVIFLGEQESLQLRMPQPSHLACFEGCELALKRPLRRKPRALCLSILSHQKHSTPCHEKNVKTATRSAKNKSVQKCKSIVSAYSHPIFCSRPIRKTNSILPR